jgi:hypothetical protein
LETGTPWKIMVSPGKKTATGARLLWVIFPRHSTVEHGPLFASYPGGGGKAGGAGEHQRRHDTFDRRTHRRLPYKSLRRPELK